MHEAAASLPTRTLNAFRNLVPFALVGTALLGIVVETTDQDTDNVRGALMVGVSAAVGTAASLVYAWLEKDHARAARMRLAAWTVIRFFLAFELTRYGMAKIVGMQFYPRYYQLDTRAIDLRPMALAWTFFGRSYGYQAFGGILETIAAGLLCFRRTTALGGCTAVTVLTNVVLVDFFYDVPVKLFSSIYLVMSLYVLAVDARRFWTFFLGDRSVPPRSYLASPGGRRDPRGVAMHALMTALVLGIPAADIVHKAVQRRVFTVEPLEGAWGVDKQSGLDDVLPAMGTLPRVYFEKGNYGFIRVDDERIPFKVEVDASSGKLRILQFAGRDLLPFEGIFTLDARRLHIEGTRAGRPFSVDLNREFPR